MKIDRPRVLMQDAVVAFVLLTRLQMPRLAPQAFDHGARAVWAYPLVGVVVGALGCFCGILAMMAGLPVVLSAAIVLTATVFATGAMHEDGLADVADGFWGGHSPEDRLAIMKDSQIGTYGTLALILAIGAQWSVLTILLPEMPAAIVASAVLSRAMMPIVMTCLPSAREKGLSQSVGRPNVLSVLAGIILAVIISTALIGITALAASVVALLVTTGIGFLSLRKLGGQTGDVLGATQYLSQLGILVLCVGFAQ